MRGLEGFEHGIGIGGWLTNYKRFNVLPLDRRLCLTVGDMEHFASYITRDDVENIAGLGADHIRLGFDQIVLEDDGGKPREVIFRLLEDFVSWCEEFGLNVVLNLHKAVGNYCDIPEEVTLLEDEGLQRRFIALWEHMEDRFAGKPQVAFELLNEVRDVDPEQWNDLAERTVKALRKKNKDRLLIVGSTAWNSVHTLKDLRVLDDDRVAYTFHTYEPFSFTHQRGVLQAPTLYYNRDMPYPGDMERYRDYERVVNGAEDPFPGFDRMDRTWLWSMLQPAADFMKAHPGVMLWCGEFGTIRHAKMAWRENWMRDVIAFLKANGIPWCAWNYLSTPNDGNRFSLVDDDSRKILSEEMARILAGEVE